MPYATHHEERIHYHVEGKGPALVLQHGFLGSIEDWYEYGYVSQLAQEYRVILIDARGHGKSSKPHLPHKYDFLVHAGDVAAVLDALQVRQCHYLGYSMGGWIGLAFARYQSERTRSIILMGSHACQINALPLQESVETMEAWIPRMLNISSAHKARLRTNDPHALLAAATSYHQATNSDALHRITSPCLVLAGTRDTNYKKARQTSHAIEHSIFVELQGLNHVDTLVKCDTVLPHILYFLKNAS